MLIHLEQDTDIAAAIHRSNTFTASLKKGQFLNLQVNSTFERSTMTRQHGGNARDYTEVQVHTYSYTVMVYYDEVGESEAPAPRQHLSS